MFQAAIKRSFLIWLIVILLEFFRGTSVLASPKSRLSNEVWDFGTVSSGTIIVKDFSIVNTGSSILTIRSVTASCKCVAVTIDSRRIAPGGRAYLKVSIDTTGETGDWIYYIMLSSNNPEQRIQRIKIIMYIS